MVLGAVLLFAIIPLTSTEQSAEAGPDSSSFDALKAPADSSDLLEPDEAKLFRLDVGKARFVVEKSGVKAFLVPSGNDICVVAVDGKVQSPTCAPSNLALKGELIGLSGCSPSLPNGTGVLTAVVPNGINSARLIDSNGGERRVEVRENVIFELVDQLPSELSWQSGGGTVTIPVPSIPGGLPKNCATAEDRAKDRVGAPETK